MPSSTMLMNSSQSRPHGQILFGENAGAVLEARARCMGAFAAGKRGMSVGSPEANRMAAVAIQELTGVLEGPYGAAERSCALQALLWTQVSPRLIQVLQE